MNVISVKLNYGINGIAAVTVLIYLLYYININKIYAEIISFNSEVLVNQSIIKDIINDILFMLAVLISIVYCTLNQDSNIFKDILSYLLIITFICFCEYRIRKQCYNLV